MTALTNKELGDRLGVSPSAASRMRSGARSGSVSVFLRLAEITPFTAEQVLRAANSEDKTEWRKIVESVQRERSAA